MLSWFTARYPALATILKRADFGRGRDRRKRKPRSRIKITARNVVKQDIKVAAKGVIPLPNKRVAAGLKTRVVTGGADDQLTVAASKRGVALRGKGDVLGVRGKGKAYLGEQP